MTGKSVDADCKDEHMTRRLFSFFLLTSLGLAAVAGAAESARPNLILFLIDDQDFESISAYGGQTWTPNLDRMAAEGMRFTRAYVSSTVCTPSRYTWLTGRYAGASTSRVYEDACGGSDRQGFPSFNVALERDRMNVGNLLREAGYTTGFVGKFHVGSPQDFPEFYGDDGLKPIAKDAEPGPETSALFTHNERVMRRYIESLGFSWAKHIYPENMHPPYAHHNPEWTTEAALEFIEANKDGPFYLHYCSTLLHGPDGSWRRSMDYPLVSGEGELTDARDGNDAAFRTAPGDQGTRLRSGSGRRGRRGLDRRRAGQRAQQAPRIGHRGEHAGGLRARPRQQRQSVVVRTGRYAHSHDRLVAGTDSGRAGVRRTGPEYRLGGYRLRSGRRDSAG